MITYEIQLRYVIRDKLSPRQNLVRDKFSARQNSVQDNTQEFFCWEKIFIRRKILLEKKFSDFVSDLQCALFELSRTNQYLSSLSGTHRKKEYNLSGGPPALK